MRATDATLIVSASERLEKGIGQHALYSVVSARERLIKSLIVSAGERFVNEIFQSINAITLISFL